MTPEGVSPGEKRDRSSTPILDKDDIDPSAPVDEQDIKPKERFGAMQKRMRFLEVCRITCQKLYSV
jgi:hypothetical protein